MRRKVRPKVESGTCNKCSAPCSSCMHRDLGHMGPKGEFSDETAASQCIVKEEGNMHAPSEGSSLPSDSLMENAESKANFSSLELINETLKEDQLSWKPSNKHDDTNIVEGHDDNISCLSRVNDKSAAVSSHNLDIDRKKLSCNSPLAGALGPEGSDKALFPCESDMIENLEDNEGDGGNSQVVQAAGMNNKNSRDQAAQALKCYDQDGQGKKLNELVDKSEMEDHPLLSDSGDECGGSENAEQDVPLCDICGDAGREDLLAICSRCTDGAEHTYCMREMLQKVPEGDWLCEECKLAEECENQKRVQCSDAAEKEVEKASSENSGKRQIEMAEVSSASKRLAIESSLASLKPSSPNRIPALQRDSSFKSWDKGKVKPAHHTSVGNHHDLYLQEAAQPSVAGLRFQSPKGTLLKSNSFSIINAKPKVKLVDEVPQKQRGPRESSALDTKEGPSRMMTKSMSFKSGNSVRSNTTESKVKMLSPKFSHFQDAKGSKQVKDRKTFERKNLSKLDRPLGSTATIGSTVSTPKLEQKLTPRGETSASNNRVQFDGKSGALSRSNSFVARKGAEPVTSVRVSATNGSSGAYVEQKSSHASSKDEPSSTAERPPNNANENVQDTSLRTWESSSRSEKIRESSDSHLRPAVCPGPKNITCQKCKGMGHAAETCTFSSPRPSVTDLSGVRGVKQNLSASSKLKAAIEAAILKKPELNRKKKENDPSSELSSSKVDMSSEVASRDEFSVSHKMRNSFFDETHGHQANVGPGSSESQKDTNKDNVGQLNVHCNNVMVPLSVVMKTSAIPEPEYVWQGAFEVLRFGRFMDIHGGIQAHLSTCASPKVLGVVNRFPQKITLDEVPRLSTWPRQFHDIGAREDNIALYFFAKDLESYHRYYKGLLDNMLKKDLALKASFDGVELLIFPSTQLPENCQRWNMLFFLWGVFRGRRADCLDSLKKSVIPSLHAVPLDNPTSIVSLPGNDGLSEFAGKETSVSCSVHAAPPVPGVPCVMHVSVNGDHDKKQSLETKSEQDSKCMVKAATINSVLHSETQCASSSQGIGLVDTDCEASNEETGASDNLICGEEQKMQGNDSQEKVSSFKIFPVGDQDLVIRESVCEERLVDEMDIDRDKATDNGDMNEKNMMAMIEAPSEKVLNVEGLNCLQSSNRKRPHLDLSESSSETSNNEGAELPSCKVNNSLVDGQTTIKKLKTGCSGVHNYCSGDEKLSGDVFASQSRGAGSFPSVENSANRDLDEKVIVEDLGTAERYFFPVDSHHKDFRVGDNSMLWKECSSNDEDQCHDAFPNLELALGAEAKSPNKGILPFLVGTVEKNSNQNQNKPPDKVTDKEEDGVSASLSLSLSFPFQDKEQTVKPVTKTDQLLPEGRCANTSLLLFRGLSDK